MKLHLTINILLVSLMCSVVQSFSRIARPASSVARGQFSRRLFASHSPSVKEVGVKGTDSFRLALTDESGRPLSAWHDIPLRPLSPADGDVNFVCEIPKNTKAKMEVATKEAGNPIAQDKKKDGSLRDYHGPIFWNYGCLPQTWEDPNVIHPELKCFGDNDPLDVVEIGSSPLPSGSVTPVKVLGVLALIDGGELDWKVIAINSKDPAAGELNTLEDLETKHPFVVSGVREWFRWYKTPDNKPLNEFGFQGRALSRDEALHVVDETHAFWKNLKDSHKGKEKTEKGLWTGK